MEQFLNQWLIFFPSDYLISVYENVRQIIDSVYFFVCGIFVYNDIKDNRYQNFNVSFLLVMIVLCAFRFVGSVVMLLIRFIRGNSDNRVKDKNRMKTAMDKVNEIKGEKKEKKIMNS